MRALVWVVAIGLLGTLFCSRSSAADWQQNLYLGHDGYWHSRVPVDIHNTGSAAVDGAPAAVTVGTGAGEANLVGAAAESVRVVDEQNRELLFAIYSPAGELLTTGPIPAGSSLVLPAVCGAGETMRCWVYFDNPSASEVPDFLEESLTVRNGGVEQGAGATPTGWRNDASDSQHVASWTTEEAHSGTHSLKLWVADGAQPTWISTRQGDIYIQGGAEYTLRGWVKTENISDTAGWYIHVGNASDPMLLNQSATVGAGTQDWTEVSITFTAPADADRAEIGTLLWGSGTAWFDDVSLETTAPPLLSATAGAVETISLAEVGVSDDWYDDNPSDDIHWEVRAPLKLINLSAQAVTGVAQVDLSPLLGRIAGGLRRESIRVTDQGALIPHYLVGNQLLFSAGAAAQTVHTYYVYLSRDERIPAADSSDYAALLSSPENLVQNPSFEEGDNPPTGWTSSGNSDTTLSVVEEGLFGNRAVKIEVSPSASPDWVGWHQDVSVQPGSSYLYAAWVRTQDIAGDGVQIHAHFRTASGDLCAGNAYAAAGTPLTGTHDWTLMSGVFTMPPDCVNFQLHLTMHATGSVWHDGVVVARVLSAALSPLEFHDSLPPGLTVWPVNPIVKVFPDDLPPNDIPAAHISAARNEKEPLQLVLRSPDAVPEVTVEVDSPSNGEGGLLNDISIGVVGYVPVDHPSGYYNSTLPSYCRRYPTGNGDSDGWAGLWPDYLVPTSTFALSANVSQPVWITVSVPADAAPGDYQGAVRFMNGAQVLKEVPFTVHVWNFTLPDKPHAGAVFDLWGITGDSQWVGPGQLADQVRGEVEEMMSAHRLCPDMIRPEPEFHYDSSTGQVTVDFTAYDQAAERYFNELKLPYTYAPSCFFGFIWDMPPGEKWGEAPYPGDYPYDSADHSQLRPEYKAAYQACLRVYWNHMKEKGWADKVVLYISDEPYFQDPKMIKQMKALCDMVHEVDPNIPTYASTWNYVPEWLGYVDIWGVGIHGSTTPEQMQTIRDAGGRLRYTVDGHFCIDTPTCGTERLLPYFCFKYDVEAYEFWGFAWLTYNPYRFGWHSYIQQSTTPGESEWIRYPNGDGFLIYPGALIGLDGPVTTIRAEQAREGMEDYEYLYLLQQLIDAAHAAGRDASAMEAALNMAKDLVHIPNAGGRYSTQLLPDPDRVLEVREVVAAAIEGSFRFSDVLPDHWAYAEIMACANAGIVGGFPDGTYRPDLQVTRDQMAVYISRALAGGDENVPTGPAVATFPDVPTDHWAYKYVEYAYANQVVQGFPEGDYRPDLPVTRDQMAVYVSRAIATPTGEAGLADYTPPSTPTFPDVPTDHWAYKYIEYAHEAGVVAGYDDGTYRPDVVVTRDQMAVYIQRAFDLPLW